MDMKSINLAEIAAATAKLQTATQSFADNSNISWASGCWPVRTSARSRTISIRSAVGQRGLRLEQKPSNLRVDADELALPVDERAG
jgi:hypothetical protein